MHGEVRVTADPSNQNNLIGCSMVLHSDGRTSTVVYASSDAGLHWRPTLNVSFGKITGDPECAFGLNGRAYYAVLSEVNNHGVTAIYTSTNAGKTWNRPIWLPGMDREYLTIDNNPASRFFGRIYLNATQGTASIDADPANYDERNGITIYHSLNGGLSFEQGITLSDTQGHYVLGMGDGTVLSDGTFLAIFGDLKDTATGWNAYPKVSTAWLKVVTSRDGGDIFEPASIVNDWYYCNIAKDSDVPSIAADTSNGPFHNRVYATWPDIRSGRCEVMLAHSDDKGKTWSQPVTVNDDVARFSGSGPDDFAPDVAVNKRGVVGVMWYDRRNDPDNVGYWVRFAVSYDGGETFLPSVPVSNAPSRLFNGSRLWLQGGGTNGSASIGLNDFQMSGGHTVGLAAGADGVFHPFWIANYTGADQAWSASVSANGQAYKNGSPALSAWRDVTNDVTLGILNAEFNRATGIVTADAYLSNTSKKTISGPIVARVLAVSSALGVPMILESTNGLPNVGALLNFTDMLRGNALAPGAKSATKRLTFRLLHVRPMSIPNANTGPTAVGDTFIQLQVKVLAHP